MNDSKLPKYLKLKNYIMEMIKTEEYQVGDKIFSEFELAEKFKISRNTVRIAISELVSEGWLYKEQGKGTFVDKGPGLSNDNSKTIGVITTYLNDYIFPSIIRGIDNVLSQNGYNIMLGCTFNMHEKERICLENLKSKNIAGLIVEPTKSALPNPNLDIYKEFGRQGIPVIFIHGYYKKQNSSYIVEDDFEAGYMATKHLLDLGHTQIGGVFKMDDMQGHMRFAGFQKAHGEKGLNIQDSRILWFNTDDMDLKLCVSEINRYIAGMADCTAMVCYNDQIAIKVIDAVRSNGLHIPDELSLVSFDDSQLATASEVKLTTVAHPKEKLGEEAAKAVMNMIGHVKSKHEIKMQPELVIRESTASI